MPKSKSNISSDRKPHVEDGVIIDSAGNEFSPEEWEKRATKLLNSEDFQAIYSGPLGEITRKERRNLLIACAIVIAIIKLNLVPNEIAAFGINFTQSAETALNWILGALIVYFLTSFCLYALSDFMAWRVKYIVYQARLSEAQKKRRFAIFINLRLDKAIRSAFPPGSLAYNLISTITFIRLVFDYFVPIVVTTYALWILI